MSIGESTVTMRDERGTWLSIPYSKWPQASGTGEIEAYVFDPSFEMPGRLPSVSLTWKGSLTASVAGRWLISIGEVLTHDTECVFKTWPSDDVAREETFKLSASWEIEAKLDRAEAGSIVAFRPLSQVHDLYVWGHVSASGSIPGRADYDQEVGISLSAGDIADPLTQYLVTCLFVDTTGGKLSPRNLSEDLFANIQKAVRDRQTTPWTNVAH